MIATLRRRPRIATPFDALRDVPRDLDRIFDTFAAPVDTTTALPAEVVETEGEMRFLIEIPGLKPEDIELTVENSVLTVSGEKRWQKEEGEAKGEYHLMERKYGPFRAGVLAAAQGGFDDHRSALRAGYPDRHAPQDGGGQASPDPEVQAGEPVREIEAK